MTFFSWDRKKADSNKRKHSVTFEEARSVFFDEREVTIPDPDHSDYEERFLTVGMSDRGRLLLVCYTETNDTIRIISARRADKQEQRYYEANG
jgi:uncharacterized DUF497 family protein